MTVVWLIVVVMSVLFVAVLFGSVLQILLTMVLSVVEPFNEVYRLYKTGQKKKTIMMTVLLFWIFVLFPILIWMIHLAID